MAARRSKKKPRRRRKRPASVPAPPMAHGLGALLENLLAAPDQPEPPAAPAFDRPGHEPSIDGIHPSVSANLASQPEDPDPEEATRLRWLQTIEDLIRSFSSSIIRDASVANGYYGLNEVFSDGDLTGRLEYRGRRYDIDIQLSFDSPVESQLRCSYCGTIRCLHSCILLMQLHHELHAPDSSVSQRIVHAPEPVDPARVEADLTLHVLRIAGKGVQPISGKLDIPDVPPSRLQWEIKPSDTLPPTIVARIQRPKKKRKAEWTKGKVVKLASVAENPSWWSKPADRAIAEIIRRYEESLNRHWEDIDIVAVADELVGDDRVTLDGIPASVERVGFGLEVRTCEDGYLVALAIPGLFEGTSTVSQTDSGLIAVPDLEACDLELLGEPTIHVMLVEQKFRALVQRFRRPQLIPADMWEEVNDALQRLSPVASVIYPPELAGDPTPVELDLVLWLRAKETGQLECALRVKDGSGRYLLPGQGPAAWAEFGEEGNRQWRRDFSRELSMARAVAFELELEQAAELDSWHWQWPDPDQTMQFLARAQALNDRGELKVEWDEKSVEPIRVLGSVTTRNVRLNVRTRRDWFAVDGDCRAGSEQLSLQELLEAVGQPTRSGYVEVRPGEFAKISRQLVRGLKRLRDALHRRRDQWELPLAAAPAIRDLIEEQVTVDSVKSWRECLSRLERAEQLEPEVPPEFRGTLRDYQLEGYRWLRRLAEWGMGGCLADDMGLGKTIQALAVLLARRTIGPSLVIAPTSVGFNWVRESQQFAPDLTAHLYRDTGRSEFLPKVGPGDLVVCSYGLALRDAEALQSVHWGTVVLDEAQFIKNSRSKTSQAIQRFTADWTLALTGTPIENHLGELWSIFRVVAPGLFGSWDQFRQKFAAPIEAYGDPERRAALAETIRPFVLRRTKEEVLSDLPPRTETNLRVTLSRAERAKYEKMRLAALGEVDQIAGLPDVADQRFRLLAILTRLRQLSCHAALVDPNWDGPCSKIELLLETFRELRDEGHRALVFSQFTSFLERIRAALDTEGISFQYLDGATPAKQRQRAVDAFQAGESDVFLISLKAGGTGLNLTGADYVIHMDPWWNPAVEDQATDRAHRIGQTRPVMVYRLVAEGTIEEKILDLHQEKRDLVESIMDGSQSAGKLSTDELIQLIRGTADASCS